MKKLFLASVMLTGFISFTFAQATKTAVPAKTAATNSTVKHVVSAKTAATNSTEKHIGTTKTAATNATSKSATTKTATTKTAATKTTSNTGIVLKKDGTPDKRYKSTDAAGPLKKDGTPDMRYKKNKKG